MFDSIYPFAYADIKIQINMMLYNYQITCNCVNIIVYEMKHFQLISEMLINMCNICYKYS
jgi:hypothetical protein